MDKNCKPSKRGLRMAMGGAFTQETEPSALEQRLNSRLAAGTLTVRGAGMLSDIENQRRGDATQRYGVDTQAATARYGVDAQSAIARMNDATQRFGIGTQADTARYGVDAQSAIARMNDATQRFGIGTQADTARYGVDAQSATARMNDATQRYGVDRQADTSRYGYDTSAATARMNDATQRYGVDTQADTARYGVDAQSATAKMNNTTNLLGMNLQADTQRYGMDSNLLSNMWRMKNGGEIQPVRLGLRNGGEIHAADGFARGGFAERASSVRWLSPRDQMDYQARMAGVDADLALKNEQLRQEQESFVSPRDLKDKEDRDRYYQQQAAHKNQAIDEKRYQDKFGLEKQRADMEKQRFDREMAASAMPSRGTVGTIAQQNAQLDLDMKKAQLAEYNKARFMQDASPDIKNGGKALGTSWGGGGYVGGQRVGYAPQEAQDSARLNERRSMYDKALRGHFNAGGFGAVRPPVNAAPSNFGMPRGYNLRDGGEIHAAKGGIWGAIKSAVGMGDSDEEFAAKMNKGEPESKQPDLAAAHAARLKREGGTWGGSGGEAARTVPTSTGKSFDGVSMQTKRSLREHGVLANGGTLKTGQGGVVPGTGKGDKIPAKYEPGEFVVSNDMLAAEPELRDHLRALREQVLAEKGMTPEEADAKAVSGGKGLRALDAFGGETEEEALARRFRELQARETMAGLKGAVNNDPKTLPRAESPRGPTREMYEADEAAQGATRAKDLRTYADAQSAALDAGRSAPALPESLSSTGNIYKTVDDQGRVTYSGGVVKAGAKFIGGDGEEFTPRGSVEYAKPGERVGMTPDGKGVAFTRASEDKNQRAADIAQNAISMANAKAQAAEDEKVRAKEQERMDMIGEVRGLEQAALSGDNRAAALLPGARNLLSDQQKTDALERSEAAKNAAHIEGIKLQTQGTLDAARAKKLAERENEMIIAEALKKTDGNSEATVDLLAKAGRGDLSKILSERVTADNDRRTKDYENMIKEFKGMVRTPDGAEIPGGAELAADELMKMVKARNVEAVKAGRTPVSSILDANDRAEMMKEATLRARAISGMRTKQTLRDGSVVPWAGRTGAPAGIIDSAVPKRIGWFDGATTLGDVERGDYEYDKYYLPQGVGQDVIDYLSETAKRKAKGAK